MAGVIGSVTTALKTAGNSILGAANKLKEVTIGGAKTKKTAKKTAKKSAKKSGAKKARK